MQAAELTGHVEAGRLEYGSCAGKQANTPDELAAIIKRMFPHRAAVHLLGTLW